MESERNNVDVFDIRQQNITNRLKKLKQDILELERMKRQYKMELEKEKREYRTNKSTQASSETRVQTSNRIRSTK